MGVCSFFRLCVLLGLDEKVVDLEAQRRAEELQCAKEQLDASRTLQQQPNLSTLAGREETVGPS